MNRDEDKYGNKRKPIVLKDRTIYGNPSESNAVHRGTVLDEVNDEIKRQLAKFGPQNHAPFFWLAILGEEVGEANKAAVDAEMIGSGGGVVNAPMQARIQVSAKARKLVEYRAELIQVAAVAVSMILSYDRNEGDDLERSKINGLYVEEVNNGE
jgi:hypothetical protein